MFWKQSSSKKKLANKKIKLNVLVFVFSLYFCQHIVKQVLLLLFVAKFVCFKFLWNIEPADLPISKVAIYLAWSGILFSTSANLVLRIAAVTKPLTSGILFSTSPTFILRIVVVAKWQESDILFSTFPTFVLRTVVVTKPLIWHNFYQHLQLFFPNFVYQCFVDLWRSK